LLVETIVLLRTNTKLQTFSTQSANEKAAKSAYFDKAGGRKKRVEVPIY